MLFYCTMLFTSLFSLLSSQAQASECGISLPQDVPWSAHCYRERGLNLISKRSTYRIQTSPADYNRLNITALEYRKFLFTQPFLAPHAVLWRDQLALIRGRQQAYEAMNIFGVSQTMKLEEFKSIRKYFTEFIWSSRNPMKKFMEIPSRHEPFQSNVTEWITDRLFTEQRLAGTNPMGIQKVTFSSRVGMHFESLKKLLNPTFNLIKAVFKVLNWVTDQKTLTKAIREGHLFVLYNPFSTNLKTMPDLTDTDPRRKMWRHLSPIAIFVSTKYGENSEPSLQPVAIQMDSKKDSKVYTPDDGDNWMLAKLNVQLTDLGDSQMVEHLNKAHFVVEALCLSLIRQLSSQHPLHDFMRFHCLGIFTTNTLAAPELLEKEKALHEIFGYGNEGSFTLSKRIAAVMHWQDLDLKNNLWRRGVNDRRRLPYYPYRDDGIVIYDVLKDMMTDYVNAYYSSNLQVRRDEELNKFAAEVSADKDGKIRGFPPRILTKKTLIVTFTRILWLAIAQHSAVGYPVGDYATFVPNVSTKLYDVLGVPQGTFNGAKLNNRKTASLQLSFFFKIGIFRYDRIFDYADKLQDKRAKAVISKYKRKLDGEIEEMLEKRNKERLEKGHLTYPYLQPKWLPNGIQD